jgi:hypothetical protein
MRRLDQHVTSSRGMLVAGVCAVLFLAVAGAAVGGVFSDDEVGTVVAGGAPSGPPDFRQPVDETVLAAGSLPIGGRWRLTSYESARTMHDGVEVEPAGLPCMRLMLASPPPGTPFAGRGHCGERGEGGFSVSSLAVRDAASGRTEVVLFGAAPETATAVRLSVGDEVSAAVNVQPGPDGFAGDVWVMPVDPGKVPRSAEVHWIGRNGGLSGRALAPGVDAQGQLSALE